jgi:hypothetical protein
MAATKKKAPAVGASENRDGTTANTQGEEGGKVVERLESAQSQSVGLDDVADGRPEGGLSPSLDLTDLRLSQDFVQACGVEELLTAVPVRKPHPQEFFRVFPGEEFRLVTQILEVKADRESYIVARSLWAYLAGETGFGPRLLVTCVTRQGVVSVWPLRLPKEDGRTDNWAASALIAAKEGESSWVRLAADMNLGAYRVVRATGTLPDPVWPERSFEEIMSEAFKDRHIQQIDHPVLQRLRGEI